MNKKIITDFVKPLVGPAFNDEWIEDWGDGVIACQLWSEDWIVSKVDNGVVVSSFICRVEDAEVIVGNKPIGTPIDVDFNSEEIFAHLADIVKSLA